MQVRALLSGRSPFLCLLPGAVIWLCIFCTGAIAATLEVWIDKSDQEMTVYREAKLLYRWPVSTARPGKNTPTGVFRPQALKRMHYSTIYDRAPMPFSIFFTGNYAIHGTTQIEKLGCVASAGCVRLHPDNAEILFNMVLEVGMSDTLIIVRD